jgi:signal transduction histidine kinase
MPVRGDAEQLAALCVEVQRRLARAGNVLHDNAGSLLAAAGLRLQLMESDYPAAVGRIREVSGLVGQAMESLRSLSLDLNSSPVRRGGLKRALERLEVPVDYAAAVEISPETGEAVYGAAAAAVEAARQAGATRVGIRVRGTTRGTTRGVGGLTVRIEDDGAAKGRARTLGPARLLARASGLGFAITTGKRTIVLIRVYALRRTNSG